MGNLGPVKCILGIIDPEYPENVEIEKLVKDNRLLESSVKLARRNGLYYYFIYKLLEQKLSSSFVNVEQWEEENKRLERFKETIELLNRISEDYGIEYILIKDCNTIPHVPRDVDVFVRVKEKEDMIKALSDHNIKCVHSGNIETTLIGESILPIDLYTKIIYFGNEFLSEDFLFDSIEKKKIFGIYYLGLNNKVEFMLTLLHSLFGHRYLTLLDFLHLKQIKSSKLDIELCKNYAKTMKWYNVFLLALERFDLIYENMYVEKREITFPYLFSANFILKCVYQIEGINLSRLDKLFINISLILDSAGLRIKDSALHNMIKRCPPVRKALLSIGYLSRSMRGDRYS